MSKNNNQNQIKYKQMADNYLSQEDYKNAVEYLNKAIELGDNEYLTYSNLGRSYNALEDIDNAIEAYKKASQLDKNAFYPDFIVATLLKQKKQNAEALIHISEAIERDAAQQNSYAADYQLFEIRGDINIALSKFGDALPDYEQAAKLKPNYGFVHYRLGQVYYETKNYELGYKIFQKAQSLDERMKSDGFIYLLKGHCLYNLKDYSGAISEYEKSSSLGNAEGKEWETFVASKMKKQGITRDKHVMTITADNLSPYNLSDSEVKELIDKLKNVGVLKGEDGLKLIHSLGSELNGSEVEVFLPEVTLNFTVSLRYSFNGNDYEVSCDGYSDESVRIVYNIEEANRVQIISELEQLFEEGKEVNPSGELDYELNEFEFLSDTFSVKTVSGEEISDQDLIRALWADIDVALLFENQSGDTTKFTNYSVPEFTILSVFSLEFRAWIGYRDEVDYEEPVEFFIKKFNTLREAKAVIINDCFKWKDGEWANHYVTISFKHGPNIFDSEGKLVSKCVITDIDDNEFEWEDVK